MLSFTLKFMNAIEISIKHFDFFEKEAKRKYVIVPYMSRMNAVKEDRDVIGSML